MIDYSFSIPVPKEISNLVVENVERILPIFESQNIPVNWVKTENFRLSLLFVARDLSIFRKLYYQYVSLKIKYERFQVSFSYPRIGISDKYHELIFLPVISGSDELRALVTQISITTGIKREHAFIPHLTLGRVGKDLSQQEYRNLKQSFSNLQVLPPQIRMWVEKVEFIENCDSTIRVLGSF